MTLVKSRGIYHARVAGKGGKSKLISTRCSDRGDALKVLNEAGVADLERAAKAGRLTREAIGHITTGRRLTMQKCLAPYQEYMQTVALSPTTINNNLTTIKSWLRDMKLDDVAPAMITGKHIASWINDPANKTKRSTRAVALSCIRALFSFMAANGWITVDVSKLVRVDFTAMSHKQKESKVREPFTDEEIERLVEYLDNNDEVFWKFAVLCSLENGLRLGDIAQLGWKCFTEEPHAIVVWTDKTNKRLVHKMSPALEAALGQIVPADAQYLFPEQRTLVIDVKKRALLSMQFTRICERLEIHNKSFHCLRHYFCCNQSRSHDKLSLAKKLAEHLSISEIQKLMGHASPKTTRGYLHE